MLQEECWVVFNMLILENLKPSGLHWILGDKIIGTFMMTHIFAMIFVMKANTNGHFYCYHIMNM